MNRLLSDGLWKEIRTLARKSAVCRAAIAYVTDDDHIKFGVGDTLIVDASDNSIACGQTKASLLSAAHRRGAKVYSCPGLHAKVILLDNVALVGSANLSRSSANQLIEATLLTDQPAVVSTIRGFIESLRKQSTPIDNRFLRRITAIKVERDLSNIFWRGDPKTASVKVHEHKTWIVSVTSFDEERYADEMVVVEEELNQARALVRNKKSNASWIRFTGRKSAFVRQAMSGHSVIELWSESATDKLPAAVYFHSPIVLKRRDDISTRFYLEEFPDAERTSLSWKQFMKLTERIGLPFRISPHSVRALPEPYSEALALLWKQQRKHQ